MILLQMWDQSFMENNWDGGGGGREIFIISDVNMQFLAFSPVPILQMSKDCKGQSA